MICGQAHTKSSIVEVLPSLDDDNIGTIPLDPFSNTSCSNIIRPLNFAFSILGYL